MLPVTSTLFSFVCTLLVAGPATRQSDELNEFPNFGVKFRPPAGWNAMPSDLYKRMGLWMSPIADNGFPWGVLVVEGGKPAGNDGIEVIARGFAHDFGGVVDSTLSSLDGTPAYHISVAKHPGKGFAPMEAIVCMHDGFLYGIVGRIAPGHSCTDAIESVRSTWKWRNIEGAGKNLTFRETTIGTQTGLTIDVPTLMHTYPTESPETTLDLGLYSLRRNGPEFFVYLQPVPRLKGMAFADLAAQVARSMQQVHQLKAPIQWKDLPGREERVLSQSYQADVIRNGKTVTMYFVTGLVAINDRAVLATFAVPVDVPEKEREAYLDLASKMFASIKPVKKAGP